MGGWEELWCINYLALLVLQDQVSLRVCQQQLLLHLFLVHPSLLDLLSTSPVMLSIPLALVLNNFHIGGQHSAALASYIT